MKESLFPKFPDRPDLFDNYRKQLKAGLKAYGLWYVVKNDIGMKKKAVADDDSSSDDDIDEFTFAMQEATRGGKGMDDGNHNDDISSSSSSSDKLKQQSAAKQKERKDSRFAFAIILNTLRERQMHVVNDVYDGNAHELWLRLNEAYGQVKAAETIDSLMTQLLSVVKMPNESIVDYVSKIVRLTMQLDRQGKKQQEVDIKHYIIHGLKNTKEWESEATLQLKMSDFASLTVARLQGRLVSEENTRKTATAMKQQQKQQGDKQSDNSALAAHNRGRSKWKERDGGNHDRSRSSGRRDNYNNNNDSSNTQREKGGKHNNECFRCGKKGHIARECRSAVKCFKCGRSGHVQADCRGKKQENLTVAASSSSSQRDSDGELSTIAMTVTSSSATALASTAMRDVYVLDSGASRHYVCNRNTMNNVQRLHQPTRTQTANGESIINEVGEVRVRVGGKKLTLRNAAHAHDFGMNLISVPAMTNRGYVVLFGQKEAAIMKVSENEVQEFKKKGIVFTVPRQGSLYTITSSAMTTAETAAAGSQTTNKQTVTHGCHTKLKNLLRQLHVRMGHRSYTAIHAAIKHKAAINKDMTLFNANKQDLEDAVKELKQEVCGECMKGKMTRLPMTGKINWGKREPLVVVAADIQGPYKHESLAGNVYKGELMDVGTRRYVVKLMKTKDEIQEWIITTIKSWQTKRGRTLHHFHTDGDRAILNAEVESFLNSQGTTFSTTTPHTPQHNIIERSGRTNNDTARCMMQSAQANIGLWDEAVKAAAYINERLPTSADTTKSPYEAFNGEKPTWDNYHTWGCDVYYHVDKENQKWKMDARARLGIFVGYDKYNTSYYRVFDMDKRKTIRTRDVAFNDNSFTAMQKLNDELGEDNTNEYLSQQRREQWGKVNEDDGLDDSIYTDEMIAVMMSDPTPRRESSVNTNSTVSSTSNDTAASRSVQHDGKEEKEKEIPRSIRRATTTSAKAGSSQSKSVRFNLSPNTDNSNDGATSSTSESSARTTKTTTTSDTHVAERGSTTKTTATTLSTSTTTDSANEMNVRRSARVKAVPWRHDPSAYFAKLTLIDEPLTYAEAMASKDRQKWKEAVEEELVSHNQHKTWSIVKKRSDMNVMGCKWVFKIKRDVIGLPVRWKARLVGKGYTQQYGVDYTDTFAPVLKYKSLRLILALGANKHTHLDQLDIKTAFLNATVDEDIYMEVPEGYDAPPDSVMKLNKALYGIKQAPKEWNDNITEYLKEQGFKQCVKDTCVFIKHAQTNKRIILGLFVDDIQVSYHDNDKKEWNEIKVKLKEKYELSDIGATSHILGMRVMRRSDGSIYLDQERYVKEKLDELRMENSGAVATPAAAGVKLSASDSSSDIDNVTEYRVIVGSLLYASKSTRADITHTANVLSRFMKTPKHTHMIAAKRALRYLNGTKEMGLHYSNHECNGGKVKVEAYCDADWGGDTDDRKSTTGYCVFLNGNLISWNTKKQPTVALSSAEAELMAISDVTKEVKWIVQLLNELEYEVELPIIIYEDNQSAMAMSENDVEHDRSKHIDIKHHFVRDEIKHNNIKLKWVSTQQQLADILTKPLTEHTFKLLRSQLMKRVVNEHD